MFFWMSLAVQAAVPVPTTPTVEDDIRCIVVLYRLIDRIEGNAKAPAGAAEYLTAGMMYFIGRAEARTSTAELIAAIERAEKVADTPDSFKAAGQRCAERIGTVADRFGRRGGRPTP